MRGAMMIIAVAGAFLATWSPAVGEVCLLEDMQAYTPGQTLQAASGDVWSGAATCAQICVDDDGGGNIAVQLLAGTAGDVHRTLTCDACADGTYAVSLKIKQAGTPTGSLFAHIDFETAATASLARWDIQGGAVRGRIGSAAGRLTPFVNLTGPSAYDTLLVRIDTWTDTSEFFVNGVSIGILDHSGAATGDKLGRILIDTIANGTTDSVIIDDIRMENCEGTCHTNVDPRLPKDVVGTVGGAVTPGSIDYTFTNHNTDSAGYDVAVAYSAGQPTGWVSLDKAGSDPLGTGASDTVVASFNTTGLAAGLYDAAIIFTDTCNRSYSRTVRLTVGQPLPCFADTFLYPNVPLTATGVWKNVSSPAGDTTGALDVLDRRMKLSSLKDVNSVNRYECNTTLTTPIGPDANGKITCSVRMEKGTGDGGNIWKVYFYNTDGVSMVEWDGQVGVCRARNETANDPNGQFGTIGNVSQPLTGTGTFDELRVVIDTVNATGEYFFKGVSLGFINDTRMFGAKIGSVGILRQARAAADQLTMTMNWDDILVIGDCDVCRMSVLPDEAGRTVDYSNYAAGAVGGPLGSSLDVNVSGASWDFIERNIAATPLTFAVSEVDTAGTANDYSWIELDNTAGALALEASDLVTATLTASPGGTPLPAGEYVGQLKFTDSCDPNTFQLRSLKMMIVGDGTNVSDTCLIDSFSLPNGGKLADQVGWRGTGPELVVDNGTVKITGGGSPNSGASMDVPDACPGCDRLTAPLSPGGLDDRIIVVKIKIKGDLSGASNAWSVLFYDESPTPMVMVWWYGGSNNAKGRIGGTVTPAVTLTGGWDTLEAWVNIDAMETTYFVNGVRIPGTETNPNPISHDVGTGQIVTRVDINHSANDGAAGNVVWFDDVQVYVCQKQARLLCHEPLADADGDSDVDQADFAVFQQCFTGTATLDETYPPYCVCFDVRDATGQPGSDNAISSFDLTAFELCASGPGIAANPTCTGN